MAAPGLRHVTCWLPLPHRALRERVAADIARYAPLVSEGCVARL